MRSTGPLGWKHRAERRVLGSIKRNAEAKTQKIVDAALAQISSQGISGFTVQSVVSSSGVALSTFYSRFESKDDLLIAVFEESVVRTVEELEQAMVKSALAPVERLKFLVMRLIQETWYSDQSRLNASMTQEYRRLADSVPKQLDYAMMPLHSLLADQIITAQELGEVRSSDPLNLAIMIRCTVTASTLSIPADIEGTAGEEAYAAQVSQDLWDFCWRGIKA